jgi:hypothetical protein
MPGPANLAFGNVANQFVLQVVNTVTTNVGANTSVERTITVPGLRAGIDVVTGISKPSAQAGLAIVAGRVSANDTLALTYMNSSGGAVGPAAETYLVGIARAAYDTQAAIPTGVA